METVWKITKEELYLEQVKMLIDELNDEEGFPSEEQSVRMRHLTGVDWTAEEL